MARAAAGGSDERRRRGPLESLVVGVEDADQVGAEIRGEEVVPSRVEDRLVQVRRGLAIRDGAWLVQLEDLLLHLDDVGGIGDVERLEAGAVAVTQS